MVWSHTNYQKVLKYSMLWVFYLSGHLERGDLSRTILWALCFHGIGTSIALEQNDLSQLFDFSQRSY